MIVGLMPSQIISIYEKQREVEAKSEGECRRKRLTIFMDPSKEHKQMPFLFTNRHTNNKN